MFEFNWPWILLLIPLPIFVYWLAPPAKQQQAAIRVPFYQSLASATDSHQQSSQSNRFQRLLVILIWLLLISALAQPRWVGSPISLPTTSRELMLAVDLSGSMEAQDLRLRNKQVDRLTVVKDVLQDFIARRKGDRLGLILFGSQAYLQAPLTFDLTTVKTLLDEALIGMAGKNTAIGDAVGLGVKQLRKRPAENRVLILLTDGANTAGEVTPLQAAELAAKEGVKIYTIGVGADEMILPGVFGTSFGSRRVNPSIDLDEKTLKAMADKTGGEYFRAKNTQELNKIYALLDELEPVSQQDQTFRPSKSFYHWPLAAALLLSFGLALSRLWPILFNSVASRQADNNEKRDANLATVVGNK
ncbi:vWA domain-containing protein [Spartinivicinus ruber]|uniref:vWA domain-containing protein n=1 Tax=Spartinivicinus ruber TaxID=2683272 RepID=UPI0013D6CFC5|nr:VWA domain-containing protein [Spartinivicinus ruber]